MKARILILSILCMFLGTSAEGQILKKLKKKVEKTTEKVLLKKTEEKTEKTVEGAIDGVSNSEDSNQNSRENNSTNNPDKDYNDAKFKNTNAKRAFYTSDVIVKTSDSKGKGSDYYFDSDEIAARGIAPDSEIPIFIDSEGFQYGYNEHEARWEKTGIMRSDGMAFMMPMMSIGLLKLPAGPTLDASEKLKNQGLNLNTFQIVEWAFIYKPEHFRTGDYEETTAPCPNGGTCPKFLYTDMEYKGSWVLFDKEGRLSEIYAKVNTQQAQGDGSYKFYYEPVSVSIPNAIEVKTPFQDLFLSGANSGAPSENQGSDTDNNQNYDSGSSTPEPNYSGTSSNKSNVNKDALPESYSFDWRYELKMDMLNKKKESLDLVFLLQKNANYQGVMFKDPKKTGLDDATIVFDMDINAMVMFINTGDSKIVQINPMQEAGNSGKTGGIEDFKIRELPDKIIMGYNSKGLEIENEEFIVQVYHTKEAPIVMANLFNLSGPKNIKIPEIDPRLVKQFSEGLVTEMLYTDKKKAKNSVLLTGQSLNQVKTSINKNEYQNMSFMGQLRSGKN